MRWPYALAALTILAVETGIALFAQDDFVRPYLGDMLAVVLAFAGIRAVTPLGSLPAVLMASAIAFAVEAGQALGLLDALGLRGSSVARTLLGADFEWRDIAAYVAGALATLAVERIVTATARSAAS